MKHLLPVLRTITLFSLFWLSPPITAHNAAPDTPLRFRITLSKEAAADGASGRLFVLMLDAAQPQDPVSVGFIPGSTWIAAQEVEFLAAGGTVEFDPSLLAYPRPFSQAKPGAWQLMALLDPDHSFAYHGQDAGDLTSPVLRLESLNPADSKPIELTISRKSPPAPRPAENPNIKLVEYQSRLLTDFWARPITLRAALVLPPEDAAKAKKFYPGVYHVHGFGGDHTAAWRQGPQLLKEMADGKQAEMIHIFLDGSFPTGHHEFADSVNNGPWGRALTEELIPYLEKQYRLAPRVSGRFLTGHSSGGWSTLWLQVNYPHVFGGTWSTAPDPVDLRYFTGIDATPGSTDNAYREKDGAAKQLVRRDGQWLASLEQFARQEAVMGEYGGQFASFEWVWSPRGKDGRPMKLFNRESGALDQEVLKSWRKYDIRLLLDQSWPTLGRKLKGKIHVICGDADTFRLEEAVKVLCGFFKEKGSDAVCETVPGRDHFNLYQPYQTYPDGLAARIYKEMAAQYEASTRSRAKTAARKH